MGIRVNAVAPGAIDTPMLRGAIAARGSDEADVISRLSLVGRFGDPAEIANAVLWLCSDRVDLHHRAHARGRRWLPGPLIPAPGPAGRRPRHRRPHLLE